MPTMYRALQLRVISRSLRAYNSGTGRQVKGDQMYTSTTQLNEDCNEFKEKQGSNQINIRQGEFIDKLHIAEL